MSDKIPDIKGDRPVRKGKASGKGVGFLEIHVMGRPLASSGSGDPVKTGPSPSLSVYQGVLARHQALLDSADREFTATNGSDSIADQRKAYRDAVGSHRRVDPASEPVDALGMLRNRVVAANTLLKASARRDVRLVKSRQARGQEAQHKELSGDLAEVKRTYLLEGTAAQLAKATPGVNEPAFQTVIAAIGALEEAKRGVDPKAAMPAQQGQDVTDKANALIGAAQAYLVGAAALDPGASDKIKSAVASKARVCDALIKQARHLALSAQFDALPVPSKASPWDEQTQVKATGLRAALAFERGGQPATGLVGKGESTSYWIREKSASAVVGGDSGDRLCIFKPTAGEEPANGSNDRKGAGAVKEALASGNAKLFAQQTGIDLGVPETGVVSVAQFALDDGNPSKAPLLGSAQMNAGSNVAELRETDPAVLARVPKEDVHKLALMDIMSLSMDRHGGNVMVDTSDPNTPRMIPIDHGASLPARADFNEVRKRFAGVRSTVSGVVETVNTTLASRAAFEAFDPKMVEQLRRLDPAAMEAGMKRQRDALAQVHPGLDPAEKVGDDSFHMSKRAMMFTRLAAKTLSPAEVQIALGVHGEALFDVPDTGFDALAQQVIAEQQPKKAALQEALGLPSALQLKVINFLRTANWADYNALGQQDPDLTFMRDPVNALKLYKTGQVNPNPPAAPVPVDRITVAQGDAMTDATALQEIVQAFPQMKSWTEGLAKTPDDQHKDGHEKSRKAAFATWTRLKAVDPAGDLYREAIAATGAADVDRLLDILNTVLIWQQVKAQNKQDAIIKGKVTTSGFEMMRTALLQDGVAQANQTLSADTKTAGDKVTDDQSRLASVAKLATALDALLSTMKLPVTAQFQQQVAAARQQSATGDPAGAERILAGLWNAVNAAYETDRQEKFKRSGAKILALLPRKVLPPTMDEAAERQFVTGIEQGFSQLTLRLLFTYTTTAKEKLDALRSLPDRPDLPPADVAQNEDDDGDEPEAVEDDQAEDELEDDAPQDDADDADDAPVIAAVGPALPGFDWHESSAKRVLKLAVSQGLIKKGKTGLGEAIRSVKKVRKAVGGIKPTTSVAKQTKTWLEAYEAYNLFGVFVGSRLRRLSDRPEWQAYCDGARAEVVARVEEARGPAGIT